MLLGLLVSPIISFWALLQGLLYLHGPSLGFPYLVECTVIEYKNQWLVNDAIEKKIHTALIMIMQLGVIYQSLMSVMLKKSMLGLSILYRYKQLVQQDSVHLHS